ncbi:RNA-binding protein 20 isoform X1 [Protobothrops mucrosquamatus]|uniref:RNA-binding protein 20 isoform X1 n=1 Tax=Protobothrops mucrosquamatus TaxID=103944 RepID=UPI00077561A7|nr:RNA-binding protein 20 isoform X1 [Protobothrops mucrosquamatus]
MNQAPDPSGPEQPERDARGSAHFPPTADSGLVRGMPQTPNLPQLVQNAAKLLDKNIFTVNTANPLLPSSASLQLAQLQAQLTLHRLKLAQTAVNNNTAAATVLNQVLSKVAMSQPLFNQLRHPSMFNTLPGHAGGPGATNTRFPPGGIHFPTQNPPLAAQGGTLASVSNLSNQNVSTVVLNPFGGVISQTAGQQAVSMGLNKTSASSTTGGFYDYNKQIFPSDAGQCGQQSFITSGSHPVPVSSGNGMSEGQLGFQKEFYGTVSKGQHTTCTQSLTFAADSQNSHQNQKGKMGSIVHERETNNQWENPSTFSSQNKIDMPSANMWPSTNVPYEVRSDLYNPEEPTPDTKFSAGSPRFFSRTKNGKQNYSNSQTRQKQEPVTSGLPVRPLQSDELNDFHSIVPLCFPHICTLCSKKVFDLKDWDQHIKGNLHVQNCLTFSENTDIHCMLHSAAEGVLHSSSPNNKTVFNLSSTEDYPLNAESYNSASSFGQSSSSFSYVPLGGNVLQRKCVPGRVVHICNLPEGSCTENDVINLGLPFGKVTNYILMKSTNQAFLEMAYTEAAQAMVEYYKEKPAMINDDKLLIRMSKRYKELQLKKPGKNVATIIQNIHSQRERDMLREGDRYGLERPRSRSPINCSLSPRSRTPSFTSCSSPRSPLSTNRTEWGNGREPWDQFPYSQREEDKELLPWRENVEEKRDRSDMWTHERKHYLRHLDLEEHVEATRGHKEKYLRGGSPSAKGAYLLPAYKMREEDSYRKSSKQKSDKYQNQTLDVALKGKRKEETRSREHKHSHCEDTAKEEMSEQKSIMMPDTIRQKQSDKDKLKDNAKKAEDMTPGIAERNNVKKGKGIAERNNVKKGKENGNENEDWESGSDMEAETWYPTNMEELVTVDEVGEDDLIMEPDITELEEIVTVGQEEEECSLRSTLAAGLEVKNEHGLLSTKEDKSDILEASIESEKENADVSGSECDNTVTKATHLNSDTDDKPDELHEIRSEEHSDQHDNDRKIDESSNFQLKLETQYISSDPSKEEPFQQSETLVDDYKEIETLEIRNNEDKDILAKKSQEERNHGSEEKPKTQANCRYTETKTPDLPEVESKKLYFSPSWEQDDVFTELNIPLGVEFVVPRTGYYCKLCGLFYTNEDAAKIHHCRSTVHYKNLQKYLSQLAEENLKMNEKENSSAQDDTGIVPHFEEKRL